MKTSDICEINEILVIAVSFDATHIALELSSCIGPEVIKGKIQFYLKILTMITCVGVCTCRFKYASMYAL